MIKQEMTSRYIHIHLRSCYIAINIIISLHCMLILSKVDMINTLRRFKVILHTRPTFGKRMIPVNTVNFVVI